MTFFVKVVLLACTAAVVAASPATAAEVAHAQRVCTGEVKWEVQIDWPDPSYADGTWSNVVCDGRFNYVETGAVDVQSSPAPFSRPGPWSYRFTLTPATSPASFTAVATQDELGAQGVLTATSDSLSGSIVSHGVQGDGTRGVTKIVLVPAGTCGSGCYLTSLRSTQTWLYTAQ